MPWWKLTDVHGSGDCSWVSGRGRLWKPLLKREAWDIFTLNMAMPNGMDEDFSLAFFFFSYNLASCLSKGWVLIFQQTVLMFIKCCLSVNMIGQVWGCTNIWSYSLPWVNCHWLIIRCVYGCEYLTFECLGGDILKYKKEKAYDVKCSLSLFYCFEIVPKKEPEFSLVFLRSWLSCWIFIFP